MTLSRPAGGEAGVLLCLGPCRFPQPSFHLFSGLSSSVRLLSKFWFSLLLTETHHFQPVLEAATPSETRSELRNRSLKANLRPIAPSSAAQVRRTEQDASWDGLMSRDDRSRISPVRCYLCSDILRGILRSGPLSSWRTPEGELWRNFTDHCYKWPFNPLIQHINLASLQSVTAVLWDLIWDLLVWFSPARSHTAKADTCTQIRVTHSPQDVSHDSFLNPTRQRCCPGKSSDKGHLSAGSCISGSAAPPAGGVFSLQRGWGQQSQHENGQKSKTCCSQTVHRLRNDLCLPSD